MTCCQDIKHFYSTNKSVTLPALLMFVLFYKEKGNKQESLPFFSSSAYCLNLIYPTFMDDRTLILFIYLRTMEIKKISVESLYRDQISKCKDFGTCNCETGETIVKWQVN